MASLKLSGFVFLLSIAALTTGRADADMIGSTLEWQYYGGGGPYDPGVPGTETSGTFIDDGGVGGTFIEPTDEGPLPVFNIDADGNSIIFDYSVDAATGPWSSSPLSLTPTIFNGIAINLLSGSSFATVTIDPATNMTGFGASNFSFTGNQIEIDWQGLEFTPSTVVELDINADAPEPGTSTLVLLSLLCAGVVWRSGLRFR